MADRSRANRTRLAASQVVALLGPWSTGRDPRYAQLADGLRRLIREGSLRPGDLVPPERGLAAELAVSRGTVVAAYDQLHADGLIERRQGSGTRVTGTTNHHPPPITVSSRDLLFDDIPDTIDMLKAVPPPSPEVIELLEHTAPVTADAWTSVEPAGLFELRSLIAQRYTTDGLPTEPEQILVTSGAQQAISLTLETLLGRDDNVLTEQLTWPGFTETVRRCTSRVHGIAMDTDGIIPDELRRACERLRPVALCLNPHHHNPTGTRLSPTRRREIAEITTEHGVTVVEDRVAAPLAFDGIVPPPLATHRPDGTIITIDSLSKTVWAGLRIGWIRADTPTVQALRARKALHDLFTSIPSQTAAIAALPHLDHLIRQRTRTLRQQHTTLHQALTTALPDWRIHPTRGGMVVRADLPHGSAEAFTRLATRYGITIAPGPRFATSTTDDTFVRIPFTLPTPTIVDAVERLATAWHTASHHRHHTSRTDTTIV